MREHLCLDMTCISDQSLEKNSSRTLPSEYESGSWGLSGINWVRAGVTGPHCTFQAESGHSLRGLGGRDGGGGWQDWTPLWEAEASVPAPAPLQLPQPFSGLGLSSGDEMEGDSPALFSTSKPVALVSLILAIRCGRTSTLWVRPCVATSLGHDSDPDSAGRLLW